MHSFLATLRSLICKPDSQPPPCHNISVTYALFLNCTILNNQASRGGGLLLTEGSKLTIDNNIISNNEATGEFSSGATTNGNGGGIFIMSTEYAFNEGGVFKINNSQILRMAIEFSLRFYYEHRIIIFALDTQMA